MSLIGKAIRIERIINRKTGNTIIVPMDHGVTVGPIYGITNLKDTIEKVVKGGANAVLIHKGMVEKGHRHGKKDVGLIIHISAGTSLSVDTNAKVLVCTVEEALKLGADAVSIHINIGAETDSEMLKNLGEISKKCWEWGMPLIAMMYARGKKIKDEYDVKYVKHAARIGAELGADIIKCNYTGSVESFKQVVDGCPVPVVIAGGEKMESDEMVLKMVYDAMQAGAKGASIGRNVFQHKNPTLMVKAIDAIVHKKASLSEAKKILKQK